MINNISQHSFVPTCQYGIDPNNKDYASVSGVVLSSGARVPRYTLYPDNASFDKRYNFMDFSMLNSVLFLSTIVSAYRPFIGFPQDSEPFGPGVYLPYTLFSDTNLVTGYTYSASQSANLDSCKTMYISDNVTDAQVRYVFWNEKSSDSNSRKLRKLNFEELDEKIEKSKKESEEIESLFE